jgi:hypothetical protein
MHPQRWFRYTIITLQISSKSIFANAVLMRQLLLQSSLTFSVYRRSTLQVNIPGFKRKGDVHRIATWWQLKQAYSVSITGTACILRRLVQLNMIIWWWSSDGRSEVLPKHGNVGTYQLRGVTTVIFTMKATAASSSETLYVSAKLHSLTSEKAVFSRTKRPTKVQRFCR